MTAIYDINVTSNSVDSCQFECRAVRNRGTNSTSKSVVLSDGSVLRYVMSPRQADTQDTKSNIILRDGS